MKIRLSGNIAPMIYIIPVILVFYTIMLVIFGYVKGYFNLLIFLLAGLYFLGLVFYLLVRQCKNIYFDNDFLYINTLIKNKPIKSIDLSQIRSVKNYIFFVKITYRIQTRSYRVFTIQDRKAIDEAFGLHELPGFRLLWGKPNFRIEKLIQRVKDKRSTHANSKS